jgi:hypothetical protein
VAPPVKKKAVKLKREPWDFPDFEEREVRLIQALAQGTATPEMQRAALAWIIEIGAATYDMPYRPGDSGRRDTDFACGKAFVGQTLVRMTKIPLKSFNQPQKE